MRCVKGGLQRKCVIGIFRVSWSGKVLIKPFIFYKGNAAVKATYLFNIYCCISTRSVFSFNLQKKNDNSNLILSIRQICARKRILMEGKRIHLSKLLRIFYRVSSKEQFLTFSVLSKTCAHKISPKVTEGHRQKCSSPQYC